MSQTLNTEIYSRISPGSLAASILIKKRQEMYDLIAQAVPINEMESILDIGATADRTQASSNYFETFYPHKNRITALSDQDASWMSEEYDGLQFVRGNALALPFSDNQFHMVFSSAVLEHVGAFTNQQKMISEAYRVAKNYIVLTTPNRWHPIELHTKIPFIHWLPKKWHRKTLSALGMDFFSDENNLNLLDRSDLRQICNLLKIQDFQIKTIQLFAWPSNLILVIRKSPNEK